MQRLSRRGNESFLRRILKRNPSSQDISEADLAAHSRNLLRNPAFLKAFELSQDELKESMLMEPDRDKRDRLYMEGEALQRLVIKLAYLYRRVEFDKAKSDDERIN